MIKNMTKLYFVLAFLSFNIQTIFPSPNYLMQISSTKILNDTTVTFDININNIDSSFILTSYQCVLTIDVPFPVYGFSFVGNSSDFKDITPTVGLGYSNVDGVIKLTFASLPGNEVITSRNLRIGKFLIKTKIAHNNLIPQLEWCFDGKLNTILTSSNFTDITNQENFSVITKRKIKIQRVLASATYDNNTAPEKTIDGKGTYSGDPNSRWAAEPMPAYLIFDLGSIQNVIETQFSFYEWDNGRIYHYSISTSNDLNSWDLIPNNASSSSEEWTPNAINRNARYVKLTFLSNNQCSWAGLWEAQVYKIDTVVNIETYKNDYIVTPKN